MPCFRVQILLNCQETDLVNRLVLSFLEIWMTDPDLNSRHDMRTGARVLYCTVLGQFLGTCQVLHRAHFPMSHATLDTVHRWIGNTWHLLTT